MTKIAPTRKRSCGPDRVSAQPWSDATLLENVSGGQRSGPQQQGESCALSTVKLPLMIPDPPRIGSRMTGALITLLSSTITNRRPTFSRVASPKRRAPTESKVADDRLTVLKRRLDVDQVLAGDHYALLDHLAAAAFSRQYFGSPQRPACTSCGETFSSTKRKVSLATVPSAFANRSGSLSPAPEPECGEPPCRAMIGSLVPNSSMRRRTISTDWSTAWLRN